MENTYCSCKLTLQPPASCVRITRESKFFQEF